MVSGLCFFHNQCEIICVYRGDSLIDAWGNRCEKGELKVN